MKVKIKNGCLVIRIPLGDLPFDQVMVNGDSIAMPTGPPAKPKPVVHAPGCLELRHAEILYTKAWPVHCRTCGGKGWIPTPEGQKKNCPRCLEFGLCPRCGNSALEKVSTEDGTFVRCPGCEWDQAGALTKSAEAAGLTAPVWRCTCGQGENVA